MNCPLRMGLSRCSKHFFVNNPLSLIGRYKDLLSQAKFAAYSWNQREIIQQLTELDDQAKEIIRRTNAEEWNVNKAVHYNGLANFGKQDFMTRVIGYYPVGEKPLRYSPF